MKVHVVIDVRAASPDKRRASGLPKLLEQEFIGFVQDLEHAWGAVQIESIEGRP